MKDDIGYDNVIDQLGHVLREYIKLQAAITLFEKRENLDWQTKANVIKILVDLAEGK